MSLNDNQHAEIVQRERHKLFEKIFALNNNPSGSFFNYAFFQRQCPQVQRLINYQRKANCLSAKTMLYWP